MTENGFSFRQYWKKNHLAILGVALTAVCALYAFLPYHFPLKPSTNEKNTEPKNNKEANKTDNIGNNQNLSPLTGNTAQKHLTPAEQIISEIEAAPPLQRKDISKAYIGLPVDWELFFLYGTPDGKNKFYLMFSSTTRRTGIYIKCIVPKDTNSSLLRITENTKLKVQGTIASIESGSIYLKDAKVSQIITH